MSLPRTSLGMFLDQVTSLVVLYHILHADLLEDLRRKHINEKTVARLLKPLHDQLLAELGARHERTLKVALKEVAAHPMHHIRVVEGAELTYDSKTFTESVCDALIVACANKLCTGHGPQFFLDCIHLKEIGLFVPEPKKRQAVSKLPVIEQRSTTPLPIAA